MGKVKDKNEETKKENNTDEIEESRLEDIEEEIIEDNKNNEDYDDEDCENEESNSINSKLLRLQADFLNYKNRVEKERFLSYSNTVADVIKDILPIIDNLERALETKNSKDESLQDGIKMIYEQLLSILGKRGLKEIESLNKKFDPNLHYGVAFDNESDCEEDTIVEVLQKGYIINEKVIRPSMVKISKK